MLRKLPKAFFLLPSNKEVRQRRNKKPQSSIQSLWYFNPGPRDQIKSYLRQRSCVHNPGINIKDPFPVLLVPQGF